MSGFAEIASERPDVTEGLSETEQRFLAGLPPATRDAALRRLAQARYRDPRRVSQDELDAYDDEQRWEWLTEVCRREAADTEQAAALAAQATMEGHHQ